MAVVRWNLKLFVKMICDMLQNKFDCVVIIEGNRGLGKSTLAIHLAKKTRREMFNRGIKDDYKFKIRKDVLYQRDKVISFFNDWRRIAIADEMINVSFNRDFYQEGQKDLIKVMNMNRDHNNLFIACVPRFQTLDSQIKDLCKIRITVLRRGLAMIQTQNRTIYSRDRWDQAVNEKIERKWIEKGIKKPMYSKLSTFRGVLRFPALPDQHEKIYQEVKNEMRNLIQNEKKVEEKPDPFEETYERFVNGGVRNSAMLDGMAFGLGITPSTLRSKIKRRLEKDKKSNVLGDYYSKEKAMPSEDKHWKAVVSDIV